MKRLLIVVLACACAGLTAIAAAATGIPASKTRLRGFVCQTNRDPAARGIAVTAVMRPLAHTMRMALRFDLLEQRAHSAAVQSVRYGDLGTWIHPRDRTLGQQPGDQFILNKQVANLYAPAEYRFKISFRWIGAGRTTLGTSVRYSPRCYQPELRPDLAVTAINVTPSSQSRTQDLYTAVIRNLGARGVGPFQVEFSDGTVTPQIKMIQQLGAHRQTTRQFVGPLCNAASPPSVIADPAQQTDDFNRANNALSATCPGA